jgi:hypothetical protein
VRSLAKILPEIDDGGAVEDGEELSNSTLMLELKESVTFSTDLVVI